MIYTRCLYDKKAVEFSLLISLLDRNREEALFWTYELYHSGFRKYTISLLWEYYYSLYSPFFVNQGTNLLKQTQAWLKNKKDDTIVGTLVENLVRCEPCIDIYMIYADLRSAPDMLAGTFNNICECDAATEVDELTDEFIVKHNCFKTRGLSLLKRTRDAFNEMPFLTLRHYKIACMSTLFTGLFLKNRSNKLDPKFYVKLTENDIKMYKTKKIVELKGYKIAKRDCLYKLTLKPGSREKNITDYDNWIYYASKSLLWKSRIERHNGEINTPERTVTFANEDDEELFYNWHNFEPDEQTILTQNMWMGTIKYESWEHIYKIYKCESYNEWENCA